MATLGRPIINTRRLTATLPVREATVSPLAASARLPAAAVAPDAPVTDHHRARATPTLPPTVNWHLEPRCNYACKFCFATFGDIPPEEVVRERQRLLEAGAGFCAVCVRAKKFGGRGDPCL